jgi:hypothetical protein
MNRANAGHPRIAWYCEGQSMTLNSNFSLRKLPMSPKQTSSSIFPSGWFALPGTIPWKEQSVGCSHSSYMFITFKVLVYIRFIPLPASMNTRSMSYPPICASNTIGTCPGLGTFLGWSSLLNLTVWSDHRRYSVVAGGDDIARFTCLDVLFCSFLDFGIG